MTTITLPDWFVIAILGLIGLKLILIPLELWLAKLKLETKKLEERVKHD